jgi:hypothetical protein
MQILSRIIFSGRSPGNEEFVEKAVLATEDQSKKREKSPTLRLHTDESHAAQGYARFRVPMNHNHGVRVLAKRLVPKAWSTLYHMSLVALAASHRLLMLHRTSRVTYFVCFIE